MDKKMGMKKMVDGQKKRWMVGWIEKIMKKNGWWMDG